MLREGKARMGTKIPVTFECSLYYKIIGSRKII